MSASSLEENLRLLREQGLQAIRINSKSQLRRIIDKHLELLGYYIRARARFKTKIQGIKLTYASLAGYESPVVYEITESLAEILREAFRSNQVELIVNASNLLVRWETLTLDHKNLSLFRNCIKLVDEVLQRSILLDDPRLRNQVVRNMCDIQKEFATFHIQWAHLEKAEQIPEDLVSYAIFLIGIFISAGRLGLTKSDFDSFSEIVDSLSEIFTVGAHDPSTELLMLRTTLQIYAQKGEIPLDLVAKRDRLQKEVQFYSEVTTEKRKGLFALGGYATKRFVENKLSTGEFSKIFEKLWPLVGDFESISELFLIVQKSNIGDRFGAFFWENEEHIRGGAVQMSTSEDSWLMTFLTMASIRTLPSTLTSQALMDIINRDSVAAESIQRVAREIRENWKKFLKDWEKWGHVFPEPHNVEDTESQLVSHLATDVERLAVWWGDLAAQRTSIEEAQLMGAGVPAEIVSVFDKEFRKALIESSSLRVLVTVNDAIEDLSGTHINPHESRIGQNILENKAWFLSGNEHTAKAIGESMGKNLGTYETEVVFLKIATNIKPNLTTDMRGIVQAMNVFIDGLAPETIQTHLILSSIGYELEDELYQSQMFDPTSKRLNPQKVPGYRGKFRDIPVADIWIRQEVLIRTVLCFDLKKFGIWLQYNSGELGKDLDISIEALDIQKSIDLIEKNPKLLNLPDGTTQTRNAAVRSLLKKIHIQIWEKFTFEILDSRQAFRADLHEGKNTVGEK